MRNTIARKKEAFKAFCKTGLEEHKIFYRKMRNQTKKVIAKAMKMEAEKEMEELFEKPNKIFKFVKFMKRDGKDVEGGKWIKGRDGRIGFSQEDRCKIWKEHMEKIMNEENAWDHKVDAAMVEGPVEKVSRKEVREAIRKMKRGKAAGLSEVTTEMIVASGRNAEEVMLQFCQRVLDGKGIPNEWKTSVVVPIFKGKEDVMNCGLYRGVKLLEQGMKIIERVLERIILAIVDFNEAQFGFMPGKGTIDALFLVQRLLEEHRAKGKRICMCFVDLEKAFDIVPRRVMEWAMRKKGLPEILVKAVMSLYEGAETKVGVRSGLLEEFSVKVGVHQGSVLSPSLFAMVIDEVTENARKGRMKPILYADDLVLMGETMEELRENFDEWREVFESKGMRVNLGKTKLMVSGMEEAFDSKIDPCGMCGNRVMSNSVLCTACGKWVHARCTEKKKVSVYVNKNFVRKKCRSLVKNIKGSADEKLCDGVETVSKLTYLGDRLNAAGGCETAVTARSRIGWMKFRECSKILKGRRFSLKMKGKIYKSCVRSGMLYGNEAWCLREKEMVILRRTERTMI